MFCENCGIQLKEENKFCPRCGTKQNKEKRNIIAKKMETSFENPKRRKQLFGAVAIVIVIVSVVTGVLIKKQQSKANKEVGIEIEEITGDFTKYMKESGCTYDKVKIEEKNEIDGMYIMDVLLYGQNAYVCVVTKATLHYEKYEEQWRFYDAEIISNDFVMISGMTKDEFEQTVLNSNDNSILSLENAVYMSDELDAENLSQVFKVSSSQNDLYRYTKVEAELNCQYKFETNSWISQVKNMETVENVYDFTGEYVASLKWMSWVEDSEEFSNHPRYTVLSNSEDGMTFTLRYNGPPRTLGFKAYYDGQELTAKLGNLMSSGFVASESINEYGLKYVLFDSEGDYVSKLKFEIDSEENCLLIKTGSLVFGKES